LNRKRARLLVAATRAAKAKENGQGPERGYVAWKAGGGKETAAATENLVNRDYYADGMGGRLRCLRCA
jgi:hypothetical protein